MIEPLYLMCRWCESLTTCGPTDKQWCSQQPFHVRWKPWHGAFSTNLWRCKWVVAVWCAKRWSRMWWVDWRCLALLVCLCLLLSLNSIIALSAKQSNFVLGHHHHRHQSLNREGHWSTTDDFATSFLHFSLLSTVLWDLLNSRPVHSLLLSFHLFLCPPCLLPLFTVPCKVVLDRRDERETWPYHCSLRLFTIVRRSSCGPVACWIWRGLPYQ